MHPRPRRSYASREFPDSTPSKMKKQARDAHGAHPLVKAFEPYDQVKEANPDARGAGKKLITEGLAAGPRRRTFIFVNNWLEGNAISTIEAILDR